VEVIVGSRQFDLVDLIEEELLLTLPLVPKHEVCPEVHESLVTGLAGAEGELDDGGLNGDAGTQQDGGTGRPNPFAALGKLKQGGSDDNKH
jgi:uncharacterized protein